MFWVLRSDKYDLLVSIKGTQLEERFMEISQLQDDDNDEKGGS